MIYYLFFKPTNGADYICNKLYTQDQVNFHYEKVISKDSDPQLILLGSDEECDEGLKTNSGRKVEFINWNTKSNSRIFCLEYNIEISTLEKLNKWSDKSCSTGQCSLKKKETL